jgi:hypothetical protein
MTTYTYWDFRIHKFCGYGLIESLPTLIYTEGVLIDWMITSVSTASPRGAFNTHIGTN